MKTTKTEMTRRVVFLDEEDDLQKAHRSMNAIGVRHVPVLRKGKVVGMLSDRDVLSHGRWKGSEFVVPRKKIATILSGRVVTCHPDHSIAEVADLMLKHQIHALPVLDGEKRLVGIITSTDLLGLLRNSGWSREQLLPFRFQEPVRLLQLTN